MHNFVCFKDLRAAATTGTAIAAGLRLHDGSAPGMKERLLPWGPNTPLCPPILIAEAPFCSKNRDENNTSLSSLQLKMSFCYLQIATSADVTQYLLRGRLEVYTYHL